MSDPIYVVAIYCSAPDVAKDTMIVMRPHQYPREKFGASST
jgi:hypothetical protein